MRSFYSLRFLVLFALTGLVWAGFKVGMGQASTHHLPGELSLYKMFGIQLPITRNDYFHASGNCDGCHGNDPTGFANVDAEGNDISPIQLWRGSMMANSAKDPFWRAKVSHEVTLNPAHQSALEDKCTSCHAPLGRYSYHIDNLGPYAMSNLSTDSLGMDGVSCVSCHKQTTVQLGSLHSGNLNFTTSPIVFGPHAKPFTPPMQDFVGLEPVESQHILDAGICAGCHTLLTESVDLNGTPTGSTFVEQATYHEWLNSVYEQQGYQGTCQGCHMPRVNDGVVLSANYTFLPQRSPVGKHELAGANVFMLKLMRDNWQQLGLWSDDADLSRTINATENMLRTQTLNVDLQMAGLTADTAYFTLRLENLAGHKFPSGYPSRRAFVEFIVTDNAGNPIFTSGLMDANHNLQNEMVPFEPHRNVINQPSQTQIYEMVMGDVNGNFTSVLERGYQHLKDNRLAPKGFTMAHTVYDTVQIVGNALTDPDFNFEGGLEGSGTDVVRYHVPLNGFSGNLKAVARIRYQTLPPRWTQEMFALNTAPINTFKNMYENADGTPFTVAADSVMNISVITAIGQTRLNSVKVYPNPVRDGVIKLSLPSNLTIVSATLLDVEGKLIVDFGTNPGTSLRTNGVAKGVYTLNVQTSEGTLVRKVIIAG